LIQKIKVLKKGLLKVENEISSQTEFDEERYKRAQNDPEIRDILSDPVMQQILQDAQTSPMNLQKHMQNPQIREKNSKISCFRYYSKR